MSTTVSQTLTLMAIGIPTMFLVILLFMGTIKLLFKIFPDKEA